MTRILYLRPEGSAGSDPGFLASADDVETCEGQAACVAKVRELSERGAPVDLVVIGPAVPRPLTAARAVRAAGPRVGLAIVVAAEATHPTRQKIALSPDISDTTVIADVEDLRERLRQVAERSVSGRRVEDALESMNLELRQQETDRRTALPQRSVSDRHLSALTRHAPDAIISVDTTGSIASWNRAATDIFGYDTDQIEGADLAELLAPGGQTDLHEMIQRARDGSPHGVRDLDLRRRDGRTVTAAVTAAPVRDGRDHVVGVVVIARDVTQQRRTEEQLRHLQKAQSLATLAGGVAHDFNNLLVSVQGWSELALEDPDDRDLTREALEHIQKFAGQAARLARQMLAYSGRTDLTFQPVDVNEIVEEMADLLRSSISKKVDLDTTLESPLPLVQADPTQLRQVILNLVTNAAEAVGEDPGRIEVRTSRRDLDPEHVVLSITDTGPGMDPDTVERIFEPFFTTKFAGRGLGLAASLGIARAHGGTIEVESRRGVGTRFDVLLPTGPPAPPTVDPIDRSA